MTQALQKVFTFDEFLDFLETQPENIRYELYDGDIVEMSQPLGMHEQIVMFLARMLLLKTVELKLLYDISSKNVLVKPKNQQSGYYPDILLLNLANLEKELLWKKQSTVSQGTSIPLVIEVVSTAVASSRGTRPTHCLTNWRDDYHKKLADYEEMGIPEYWIVDYIPFGSKMLIGESKQPVITIYTLNDDGEYQNQQFRGDERIESPTFPDLSLTAEQVFSAKVD
jgi:Uma2 family endonuclease